LDRFFMDVISTLPVRHLGVSVEAAASPEIAAIEAQQALVLGIGAYSGKIRRLENAPHDARAVAELLVHDYGFALAPAGDPLLDECAGLATIRSTVHSSLAAAGPTTRWMFFFAGHGLVMDGQGFLLPGDAIPGDVSTYLPIQWLLDQCLGSGCGEALILLDACFGGRALVRSDQLTDYIPTQGSPDRVRQLITSGNPDQPVLDGGGFGHSIFAQALLEALQGWAGVHENDGSIRFSKLLDHLVFEIPARLRSQGMRATQQQPIGGNLVGNQYQRDFVFQCNLPRLAPETIRGTRSEDPVRRRQDLDRLVKECQQVPELTPLAVKVASLHLERTPDANSALLVTSTLRYEPVVEVRAAAATALGGLGDPSAVDALIEALGDDSTVCRAAAQALGQLGAVRAAEPLLKRLHASGNDLLLDLIDALGAVGDLDAIVNALREAKRRGLLVPFVGPDFAQELTGLPDRATLARRLAQREGLPETDSLAQVATGSMRGASNRYGFTAFMKRQLDDQLLQPGSVHRALAALKMRLCISGAYDGLLAKAMEANQIVTGADTKYWRADRPTVVRLMGDLAATRELVVLSTDYESLRENEGDRQLLVSYLRGELQGRVVLFLGYDPRSPDFGLLVAHVLNRHLAGVDARALLAWPGLGPKHRWGAHTIRSMELDSLALLKSLSAVDDIQLGQDRDPPSNA
jgi:hypothetical protein